MCLLRSRSTWVAVSVVGPVPEKPQVRSDNNNNNRKRNTTTSVPSHAKRLNIVTVTFFLALICGWRRRSKKIIKNTTNKQQHNTNRNAIKLVCLITRYLPIAHTVPMHRKEEMVCLSWGSIRKMNRKKMKPSVRPDRNATNNNKPMAKMFKVVFVFCTRAIIINAMAEGIPNDHFHTYERIERKNRKKCSL